MKPWSGAKVLRHVEVIIKYINTVCLLMYKSNKLAATLTDKYPMGNYFNMVMSNL